jgi:hypothetical protein
MDSRMAILTEVEFRHEYFRNGRCRHLSVQPAPGSLRDMMNHGLLLKTMPGGFSLLYDTNHAGSQRLRSAVTNAGLVIRCLVKLTDSNFYNYTSLLPLDINRQVLYLCNRPGRPFLHTEEQVSGSDLFETTAPCKRPGKKIVLEPAADRPFERPFAILDLRLYPGLETRYHISFQARSSWWNYILAGNHLKALREPAILSADRKKVFTGPSTIRLPGGNTGLSFISPAPVGIRESPADLCTLVENFDPATGRYKVVIATLPVPDPGIISRVNARNKQADHSEMILY